MHFKSSRRVAAVRKIRIILSFALILSVFTLAGCRTKTADEPSTKSAALSSEARSETTVSDKSTEKVSVTKPVSSSKSASAKTESTTGSKNSMSEEATSSLKKLRKKANKSSVRAAVSFLGYVNEKNSKKQIRSFIKKSDSAKKYPFLKELPYANYALADGAELYAVVPLSEDASVTVFRSKLDENGKYKDDKSSPLFTGKPGEAVILCCNKSDIYSDVLVTLKDENKKDFRFRPFISLENGKLSKNKKYYDFSLYEEKDVTDIDVQMCYEILFGADEVRHYMDRGMSLVYLNKKEKINGRPCWIFALGTNRDDQFVTEQLYGVCDNLIYAYDTVSDSWQALGMG